MPCEDEIESKTGEITISSTSKDFDEYGALKARDIISAISSGFSPERAFRILNEETLFQILDCVILQQQPILQIGSKEELLVRRAKQERI